MSELQETMGNDMLQLTSNMNELLAAAENYRTDVEINEVFVR